jgi:hypothetical protein
MQPIHLLHLTDLHLSARQNWEQDVLLDALLQDLRALRQTEFAPSLVIFSGDLAKAADVQDSYTAVLGYLLSVAETLELDENRIILCPGNHDGSRSVVGPAIPQLREWRKQAHSTTGANNLVTDPEFVAYVRSTFEEYASLAHAFGHTHEVRRDTFSTTYFVRDLGITIASVNTSILTGTGVSEDVHDRGALCLPERVLVEAMKAGPDGSPVVVVGHHPTSWLNDQNAVVVEAILNRHAIAYFCGHLHDSSPKQIRSLTGDLLHVQSGALHTARDRWNGYAIASLDLQSLHARIQYRRWFEKRREFSKAEDLGNEGIFYSSDSSKALWLDYSSRLDHGSLRAWKTAKLQPTLDAECNDCFAGQSLESIFVPPDFEFEVPYGKEADGRIGSRLSVLTFNDVASNNDNYILSARPESGKTTLLRQLALHILKKADKPRSGSIPVLISFGAIRPYAAHIESLIRQKLPTLPREVGLKNLIDDGYLTVLVDDVDFAKAGQRDALTSFITSNPHCRYILASSTTFVESADLRPEITPTVPFTRLRMRRMRQEQLLTLIENHGTHDPKRADQILERVVRDASALNVPLTAVTGTFLIQILKEDPEHIAINQAALIERYLEMVLQKYAPRELLPGTFDFTNKIDLLCAIAEQMVRHDNYRPSENTLLEWSLSYLKGYGLDFSATDLVKYFIGARVLEHDGDAVRFRLRMFFEFLVARRMIDNDEFRSFVFSEENYLRFLNEIGFYAAIHRRDKAQLEKILEKFLDLGRSVWSAEKGVPDAEAYLRDFKIPGKDTTIDELKKIESQIWSTEAIKAEREASLSGTELVDNQTQDVQRPSYSNDNERWMAHLLLASGMVKHTELIPDADKKRFLAHVLDGWVRFTVESLGNIGDIAQHKRITFNGITYRTTLAEELPPGELGRRLALSMPIAAARMATTFLGSEKLRTQLESGIGSSDDPKGRQFMRFAVLADLGVDSIAQPAAKLSDALKDHKFLQFSLARKLYEIAVRFRIKDSDLKDVRNLVADINVQLEGVPSKGLAARKAAITTGMMRQRLQLDFRPGSKDRQA